MWCDVVWCNVMWCNAMQCNAMQCNAMQCNAIWDAHLLFILYTKLQPNESVSTSQINIGCKCFILLMKKMHINDHVFWLF